jgi:hypothetical protein
MPLSDGFQTEKDLSKETEGVADAITEFFQDLGIDEKRGFILFVCDLPTGTVQFMSDLKRDVTDGVLKAWIEQNLKDGQ